MKKGDSILIQDNGHEISVKTSVNNKKEDIPKKEFTIMIDGKNENMIKRELRTAYMHNFGNINLMGDSIPKRTQLIHNCTQNLLALEVMEQTAKRITARDFINIEEVSIEGMIRKIDFNIRSMLSDAIKIESKDEVIHIIDRDEAINKMCFLLFRYIRHALKNPSFMRKMKLDEVELLDTFRFVEYLEKIGDQTKIFAKEIFDLNVSKQEREQIAKIYSKLEQYYLDIMKAHYTKNGAAAFKLAEIRDELLQDCDNFLKESKTPNSLTLIIERCKDLVQTIHNIERIAYKYSYELE